MKENLSFSLNASAPHESSSRSSALAVPEGSKGAIRNTGSFGKRRQSPITPECQSSSLTMYDEEVEPAMEDEVLRKPQLTSEVQSSDHEEGTTVAMCGEMTKAEARPTGQILQSPRTLTEASGKSSSSQACETGHSGRHATSRQRNGRVAMPRPVTSALIKALMKEMSHPTTVGNVRTQSHACAEGDI